jgi:hypothetical protein
MYVTASSGAAARNAIKFMNMMVLQKVSKRCHSESPFGHLPRPKGEILKRHNTSGNLLDFSLRSK